MNNPSGILYGAPVMMAAGSRCKLGVEIALVIAAITAIDGCSSCSRIAGAKDPLAFIPADVVALLEVDVSALENQGSFRKVLAGVLESGSCLAPLVLEDTKRIVLAMGDTRPDLRTVPYGAIVLSGADPDDVAQCLSSEFFPGAGKPDEEDYRGVSHIGYPLISPVRVGIVNQGLILMSDRAGIQRMVDTFLDGKPSLADAGSGGLAEARALLSGREQLRIVAKPGPAMRESARTSLHAPWSALLDADLVALGLEFSVAGIGIKGWSRVGDGSDLVARSCIDTIEELRAGRIMRVLGVSDLLAGIRFSSSGKTVVVEGTAGAEQVERFMDGAGSMIDLDL